VPTESGRPVSLTGDEYAAIIDELIILHEATTGFEIPVEHKRAALVLAAMEAETTEAGRATRVLMNAGLHDATALHVRKALEFGVTAQWIAATPNGVDAFFAESERGVRALYEEGKQSGQQMPEDIAQQYEAKAEDAPDEAKIVRWFVRIAETFGKHNGIYLQYRVLSGHCHPSVTSSLAQHFKLTNESDVGMVLHTTGGERHDEWLFTLGIALLWAASAVDQYVVNEPRSDTLSAIAERLGVPARLEPAPPAS
jgi:hypothetical protein